ncbi:MAG: filamentous hemagglutinin N-terminal domain-containing protein [Prochloraceae cyanobacterium]
MKLKNHKIILLLISSFCFQTSINAQIIPDSTLGGESSQVIFDSQNSQIPRSIIQGGARRGNLIFHSFHEFNVNLGRGVYFTNPAGTTNIFTRVTGNNISRIEGTLGVLGNANLFLMNPNGVLFGKGAKLDINGSFFATTANYLKFDNNTNFSAINPQRIPQVEINFTPGLGFGFNENSGTIEVQGEGHNLIDPGDFTPVVALDGDLKTGLSTNSEKTVGLIGGKINFLGGIITAPSGHVEIGSVNLGEVQLNKINTGRFMANYQKVKKFDDISFSRQSLINSSGTKNGNVQIFGKNIDLIDSSVIFTENQGINDLGKININATNSLNITGVTKFNQIFDGNTRFINGIHNQTFTGKGADIIINSPSISVKDAGYIISLTYGSGETGNISLSTSNRLEVLGNSPFKPDFPVGSVISTTTFASGNAGKIELEAKDLFVRDGALISSTVYFGSGSGGNININASNNIEIEGFIPFSLVPSSINSITQGIGNSGNLFIDTKNLLLKNGGRIGTLTVSIGNSGNVLINATEKIKLNGFIPGSVNRSSITASANTTDPISQVILRLPPIPEGKSGDLTINTPTLFVENGAAITVFNNGTQSAGNLVLNANNIFLNQNSSISATARLAPGGSIKIKGYQFNTPASIISLNNNSAIETNNNTTTDPTRASIDIFTHDLTLNNGSRISANVSDSAQNALDPNLNLIGGNINIQATGDIRVLNNSSIAAEINNRPGGTIDGGNINIQTQGNILLSNNISPRAAISASVDEFGNGGNINITLPNGVIVGVNNADIRANAIDGNGGNIIIEAFSILTTPDIDISASSERGVDGVVELNSTIDSENFLIVEQTDLPSYNQAILSTCKRPNNDERTTFEENQNSPQSLSNRSQSRYRLNSFLSTISRPNVGKTIEDIKMLEPNATIEINGDVYLGKVCLSEIKD